MMIKPTPYDREIFLAVRALFAGQANEGQQKRAMEWLVLNACHIGQLSFDVASDRLAAFRDGERNIGLQLVRMREPEGELQLKEWETATAKARSSRASTKQEAKHD